MGFHQLNPWLCACQMASGLKRVEDKVANKPTEVEKAEKRRTWRKSFPGLETWVASMGRNSACMV